MRALIFLNGELYYDAWKENPECAGPWDLVICADGGGRHALALGFQADILLGDFDSLTQHDKNSIHANEVITFPTAKDATDAELAVLTAIERGASEVALAGALGGRFDHTLANIGLLSLLHQNGATGYASDGRQVVYFVTAGTSPFQITGITGQLISLLPLTTTVEGVTLCGTRWPLANIVLRIGSTRTVSNELTGNPASVRVASGELLVVIHYGNKA